MTTFQTNFLVDELLIYKMTLRYFDNPYIDLKSGDEIEMDYRIWRARIKKIVESILKRETFNQSLKGKRTISILQLSFISCRIEMILKCLTLQKVACTSELRGYPTCCGMSPPSSRSSSLKKKQGEPFITDD